MLKCVLSCHVRVYRRSWRSRRAAWRSSALSPSSCWKTVTAPWLILSTPPSSRSTTGELSPQHPSSFHHWSYSRLLHTLCVCACVGGTCCWSRSRISWGAVRTCCSCGSAIKSFMRAAVRTCRDWKRGRSVYSTAPPTPRPRNRKWRPGSMTVMWVCQGVFRPVDPCFLPKRRLKRLRCCVFSSAWFASFRSVIKCVYSSHMWVNTRSRRARCENALKQWSLILDVCLAGMKACCHTGPLWTKLKAPGLKDQIRSEIRHITIQNMLF